MKRAELSQDMQELVRRLQQRTREQAQREDRTGSRYTNADKVIWKVAEPPTKVYRRFSKPE